MTFNEDGVLRDALLEFILARGCDPDRPEEDKANVIQFVNKRDAHTYESTRIVRRTTELISVRAARDLLHRLSEEGELK